MRIRKATTADAELIIALQQRCFYQDWLMYREHAPAYNMPLADMKAQLLQNHCHVVVEGSRLIASAIVADGETPGANTLINLCVHPGFQRQGIGSRLLSHIMQQYTGTWQLEALPTVQPFYLKHGFIIVERYHELLPLALMQKSSSG